ncbi:DUF1488 domain-containing protein [Pantoea rodasii]|uniref:DUF1488 domain-containing protein n=1 Tax=Pantoea rodasii TaxID=1076549 RepID=A0A2M9WH56_9GAMM|nr:DUF1488 domain-containing protein [Pantoea rodasii]ORM60643.1 hypothetical protein HA45_21675 [Pantoea rodasii]PJZ06873.1 DUF1488 domain-containing protein [Pantoea rodasii]
MNQSIHFPDRESWDDERQAILFPVLLQGMGLTCAIKLEALYSRFGSGEAMALFRAHRWDLEEDAEMLIRQDEIDDQGWIWLS